MASFDLLDDGTVQSEGTLLDLLMNEVDSPPVMQQPAHSLNTESLLDRIKELEQSKSELESQLIMQAQQMQIQEAALPRPSQGKSLSNHTSINTYTKTYIKPIKSIIFLLINLLRLFSSVWRF